MSAPAKPSGDFVTTKAQLVEHLAGGCKPPSAWRIGTEHEKFGFTQDDLRPLDYGGPAGIEAVLAGLEARFGWQPIRENGRVIALSAADGANVSLEPGGQLELSGAAVPTLHDTCAEVGVHLEQLREVCVPLGVAFIGLGFNPRWRRQDIPIMPKGRYDIMSRYMPTRGGQGLDMMLRTCTVQVNLDFASEADMVKKLRVSLALQPLATALWANSPFRDGKPTGLLSARSAVWLDTDPDRTGMLPFAFDEGMSFERYVDWALDVPMYFVYRQGRYIDAAGQSFRDFLAGRLPALPGQLPTMGDWNDHLTTVFPEVRLKRYLEMRGADGGPWRRLCALPAFWTGLLYDDQALDEAWELVKDWTGEERETLRREVPRSALHTAFRGATLQDMARRVLGMARGGLTRRARRDGQGYDESGYLNTLQYAADSGRSPAEELLDAYHGRWNGSVDPVFREFAY